MTPPLDLDALEALYERAKPMPTMEGLWPADQAWLSAITNSFPALLREARAAGVYREALRKLESACTCDLGTKMCRHPDECAGSIATNALLEGAK